MENNDLSNEELAELKNLAKALKQMRESDNKSDQNAVTKIENAVADIEKEQEESNNIEEKSTEVLKTEKKPSLSVQPNLQNTYTKKEYWQIDNTTDESNKTEYTENFYQREARLNASQKQNNSQNQDNSKTSPYDADKTGLGVIFGIFIPLIFSLLIGFCLYPAQSNARATFFKAYWVTFGICAIVGVIIGSIISLNA